MRRQSIYRCSCIHFIFILIYGFGNEVSAQNIAFNRSTIQISTNYGGASDRAVDGNKNQAFGGGSCTHTVDNDVSDWWRVDLEHTFNVTEVTIYGRDENCCDSWLYNFTIDAGVYEDDKTINYSTCYTQIPHLGVQKTFYLHNCSARYIRIRQMVNKNPLTLCEVEVFGEILFSPSSINAVNIALSRNTDQISTNYDGFSNLAVDGNKNQFYSGQSCTHTVHNDGPDWWQVDLGDTYNVTEVVIYGRMDICCDKWLFSFTIEGGVDGCNGTINYKPCYTQIDGMGIVKSFLLTNCSARYIRIRQLSNKNPLNLCEVEVYGTLLPLDTPTCGIETSTVSSSSDDTTTQSRDLSYITTLPVTTSSMPSSIVKLPSDTWTSTDDISTHEISQTLTEAVIDSSDVSSDVTDISVHFGNLYTSSDSYVTLPTSTEPTSETSVLEGQGYSVSETPTSSSTSFRIVNSSMLTETFVPDTITATSPTWESSSRVTSTISPNSTSITTQYTDECRCRCKGSHDKFLEEILMLQRFLAVNTTSLSSQFRKKNSMSDERLSAISIGYTGVAILVMFFGLFVLNDILTLLNFAYSEFFKRQEII